MNTVGVFKPRFYEILECQPCQLSIAQLSRCLLEFFREKQVDIRLPEEHYISTTHNSIKELTGIDDEKYVLQLEGNSINDWWDLVMKVYKRWNINVCCK